MWWICTIFYLWEAWISKTDDIGLIECSSSLLFSLLCIGFFLAFLAFWAHLQCYYYFYYNEEGPAISNPSTHKGFVGGQQCRFNIINKVNLICRIKTGGNIKQLMQTHCFTSLWKLVFKENFNHLLLELLKKKSHSKSLGDNS